MTIRGRFTVAAAVFAAVAAAEMVGGAVTRSLAVTSDGVHNLADALALSAAVLALEMAMRRDPSATMHYGYHRLEVVSALANGVVLFAIGAGVIVGAVRRFGAPATPDLGVALPLVVGSLALNLGVALWLRPHGGDVSQRAAFLHVLADTGWSAAVLVALVAMAATDRTWIDPVAAVVVAVPVLVASGRVIANSGGILLQKSHLSPADVAEALRVVPGVIDVPDLRVWRACSYLVVGTAHVVTDATALSETSRLAADIRRIMKDRFGIGLVTLEFETPEGSMRHSHALESTHPPGHVHH